MCCYLLYDNYLFVSNIVCHSVLHSYFAGLWEACWKVMALMQYCDCLTFIYLTTHMIYLSRSNHSDILSDASVLGLIIYIITPYYWKAKSYTKANCQLSQRVLYSPHNTHPLVYIALLFSEFFRPFPLLRCLKKFRSSCVRWSTDSVAAISYAA